MKLHASRILLCSVLCCALASIGAAQGRRGRRGGPPPGQPAAMTGTYTTVSGTISQFNYDRDGEIAGFLLNNNTLVQLPPRAAARIGTLLHRGDTVQIAGLAQSSPTGWQTITAQSVQDRTSGKTFTIPQPGAAAPYSGSGRIEQLNYGPDGAINGFLLDNGTLATIPPFSASNPSSIRVGASVTYSGYARNTISGRAVVDLRTLSVNGQPLAIGAAGPAGGPAAAGPADGPAAPPPPPPGAEAPPAPPAPAPVAGQPAPPAGRTDQPPPPPPPSGPPQR